MAAEPVKEAADPAREAEKAPPTVLHGTLTVEVPGGETMVLKTTFDSGSNTDAVSEKVAIQLKKLGVPWGEAGGGVSMAVSSSVAVPHGELRLLLSAEPSGSDGRADELAIPRPLQFVTDALIPAGCLRLLFRFSRGGLSRCTEMCFASAFRASSDRMPFLRPPGFEESVLPFASVPW